MGVRGVVIFGEGGLQLLEIGPEEEWNPWVLSRCTTARRVLLQSWGTAR